MFVPMPLLILGGLIAAGLILLLLRRANSGGRDLIAPPKSFPRAATPGPRLSPATEAEIRALVATGQKLAAIKRVREESGLGLREAKEWVESLR